MILNAIVASLPRKSVLFSLSLAFTVVGCGLAGSNDYRYDEAQVASLDASKAPVLDVTKEGLVEVSVDSLLGNDTFDFGSLISEIRTVRLETTASSVLGGIYKLIVTDGHIYVYDNYKGGGVAIFDGKGGFLRRLSHGRGPGELFRASDVDFDKWNEELYVYQHPFFSVYDKEGNYLRDIRLPLGFYNFKVTKDGYLLKTTHCEANQHMGEARKFSLFALDRKLKLTSAALPGIIDLGFSEYTYLTSTGDDIYVSQPFEDFIYRWMPDGELSAKYLLKYPEHHIDVEEMKRRRSGLMSFLAESEKFYHHGRHLETPTHSLFFLNSGKGVCAIYRNKRNGALAGGKTQMLPIEELPPMPFPIATYGNYFVSLVQPSGWKPKSAHPILSETDAAKVAAAEEDDNPVVVLFKVDNL